MSFTIAEKIMMKYSGQDYIKPGDIITIEPSFVMSHDNTAFIIKKFLQTGHKKVWDRNKIAIIFDHCVPAEKPEQSQNHKEAGEFAVQQA